MCLVFFAFSKVPDLPLLVLFNRDEEYSRPTAPLSRWQTVPSILGGRDLLRGGTWAGVRDDGAFACVTFVRERYASAEQKRSRGLLVSDFLRQTVDPERYVRQLVQERERYWGFNILVGSKEMVFHFSNRSEGITELTQGIHGVSNATLNTPWPKVVRGKARLGQLFKTDAFSDTEALNLMSDCTRAEDSRLPGTGIPLERERHLSSLFVKMPTYGTRTTSLIGFHADEGVEFTEWTHAQPENDAPVKRKEWFSDEKV